MADSASRLSIPTWAVVAASIGGIAYVNSGGTPEPVSPTPLPFVQDLSESTSQAAVTLFPTMAANCDQVAAMIDAGTISTAEDAIEKLSTMNKSARITALRPPQDALEQADGELTIISRLLKRAAEGYRVAAGQTKKSR